MLKRQVIPHSLKILYMKSLYFWTQLACKMYLLKKKPIKVLLASIKTGHSSLTEKCSRDLNNVPADNTQNL